MKAREGLLEWHIKSVFYDANPSPQMDEYIFHTEQIISNYVYHFYLALNRGGYDVNFSLNVYQLSAQNCRRLSWVNWVRQSWRGSVVEC